MESEKKEFNEWNFVAKILKDIKDQGYSKFDISEESSNMLIDLILIDEDSNKYIIKGAEARLAFIEVLKIHNLEYETFLDDFKAIIKPQKD
jgi:uncharacterized protein YecA (UPF0149 family)